MRLRALCETINEFTTPQIGRLIDRAPEAAVQLVGHLLMVKKDRKHEPQLLSVLRSWERTRSQTLLKVAKIAAVDVIYLSMLKDNIPQGDNNGSGGLNNLTDTYLPLLTKLPVDNKSQKIISKWLRNAFSNCTEDSPLLELLCQQLRSENEVHLHVSTSHKDIFSSLFGEQRFST